MGSIILITGGCRSGKSGHAQHLAESLPEPRVYVATCPPIDDEMRHRIERHQAQRVKGNWRTVEAQREVAAAIAAVPNGTVLVDCLTLWINNLMYEAERTAAPEVTEDQIAAAARDLLTAARERSGATIFVTNEVGMGIIPDNPVVRCYRDLAGRCNQVIGAGADQVILMVSGIPLTVK